MSHDTTRRQFVTSLPLATLAVAAGTATTAEAAQPATGACGGMTRADYMRYVELFNANDPAEQEKAERCGEDILKLCVDLGGCLTGEHGVGIEKRDLMTYQFNTIDLDQQMRVKSALDPQWLLNPHKVFPLAGRPV